MWVVLRKVTHRGMNPLLHLTNFLFVYHCDIYLCGEHRERLPFKGRIYVIGSKLNKYFVPRL